MDKVNMSVAIIPMALDFGWSPAVSGIVHSSFFYGYMLCQLPSGYLSATKGGRRILPMGVGLWSGATALLPLAASTGVPGLCASRALVGLGEAVAPAAAIDLVARSMPPGERSRATSFVFGGLHLGSVLGLLAAPALIHAAGWRSVFVVFGGLGLVWVVWFEALMARMAQSDPQLAALLAGSTTAASVTPGSAAVAADTHAGGDPHHAGPLNPDQPIPYRAFLRSQPVQALCFTHFAHNYFHYTMLAWLPSYFTSTLNVDLMHAAQTALLPPVAGIVASAVAGPLADGLIERGVPLPVVRKGIQGLSFVGPLACLYACCSPDISTSPDVMVLLITVALGVSSLSLAGLYCTHQDMSPKYASALLGLTNTVGAMPGILGVATVGWLYDTTHSWEAALFAPSMLCMVAGAVVYTLWASNAPTDFDAADNSPFAWEAKLPKLPQLPQLPQLPWASSKQAGDKQD